MSISSSTYHSSARLGYAAQADLVNKFLATVGVLLLIVIVLGSTVFNTQMESLVWSLAPMTYKPVSMPTPEQAFSIQSLTASVNAFITTVQAHLPAFN